MNIKKTFVVFRKEILDLFRDKRTIITSIVLPIILYPLLMIGFNSLMTRQTIKLHEQQTIVYLKDEAGNDYSRQVREALENAETIQVYQETESYEKLFEEKIIQAIITVGNVSSANDYDYLEITVTYNSVDEMSDVAFESIVNALKKLEKEMVIARLNALNLTDNVLKVIDISRDDVASESQTLGLILSKILPYFLILISISGAAIAAVDLVAGEKERGTLETILVSAAKRNELVIGKFLAVISISILTVVLNLGSIFLSFRHLISQASVESVVIEIPFVNLILIFVLMIPMLIFFSALLLSFSTYSRNMKECYSYTQPIMIAAMLASLISTLPAIENTFALTLIPIINVSLTVRDVLTGDFNLYLFLSTLISTLVLVILSIWVSVKLFSNESVLFRTSEEGSIFKKKKSDNWALNPNFAVFFFLVILLLFFYLGMKWQAQDVEIGLIKTLVLLVFLPTILLLSIGKLNIKHVLRLNSTNPFNFILVPLLAIPLFVLVTLIAQVINIFFPIPPEYVEMFEQLVSFKDKSIWYSLFLIALLPGICEEIMFRGYFIRAYEKKGVLTSILLSAILFGVLHLDIYRLLPVTILGIWMGYVVLKTNSIFVPMLAHATNNAISVLIIKFGDFIPDNNLLIKNDQLAWWLAIPALILFLILLHFFKKVNTNEQEDYRRKISSF